MKNLLSIVVLFVGLTSFSQPVQIQEGQLIVRFAIDASGKPNFGLDSSRYEIIKPLVESMGLYLVRVKGPVAARSAAAQLNRLDSVIYAQPDHIVKLRSTEPKDADFAKQWSLKNIGERGADIKATDAWDLGVGGKDASGNDIVVAIVDGGMDIKHEDLVSNLWVNSGEIAGNNIDDDGNGYVDDVNGWNAFNSNGNINAERHGTHVAGITGAAGNNGKHIAGVNWNVKLMPVMAASGETSVVLAGYGYVLKQKKLWLESEGKKGANIVATNSSFGVDGGKCDSGEFVAWNDIYNEMGKVGILSAAATANAKVDVDADGDIPTGCSSDYLITVTNTDRTDSKYEEAGFGKTMIDIGAPGTDIYSTLPNNRAGKLTGTSMATPHIAGAIGFLHSVLSKDLSAQVKTNPDKAALAIKNILLTNVDAVATLKGITVSEGRLNLFKAATAARDFKLQ